MADYIDLERNFWPVKPDREGDPETIRRAFELELDQPISWKNLLEKRRVVVIAEPGTGKTEEFQAITNKLRKAEKTAFFARIELLQSGSLEVQDSIHIGTAGEFNQWLTENKEGYFFLDSVDEARLNNRNAFEIALRRFAKAIKKNLVHAKVFLSCRVSNWRATADLALFKTHLPIPRTRSAKGDVRSEIGAPDDNNKAVLTDPSVEHDRKEGHQVFQLAPLNDDQINKFAEFKKVEDPREFIQAIDRADAQIFAERPQDLLDLIEYWRSHGKLGQHFTMLEFNIQKKLIEHNTDKEDLRPLSMEEAMSGAERIAAAMTLQRKKAIILPDQPVDAELHKVSIEPKEPLLDWPPDKINTLLDRAIFDEAIYGTVRFHHRSVRELLVASWLKRLNNQGVSRRQIEGLLFGDKYGRLVVITSMRPIAAWLALWDDSVRGRIHKIAPGVLIEFGDPGSLPLESKKALIIKLAERYSKRSYIGDSFDMKMIRRLADRRLADTINSLLIKYKNNDHICRLLLELIWLGKICKSVDAAFPFALNEKTDSLARRFAVRAIAASGTDIQTKRLLKPLLADISKLDSNMIGDICSFFFPKYISVMQLLIILEKAKKPGLDTFSNIERSVDEIFENTEFNEKNGKKLIDGLSRLLKIKPYIKRRHCELSKRYGWLLPRAIRIANQFIQKKHSFSFYPRILDLFLNFSLAKQSSDFSISDFNKLTTNARSWPEFKHHLFWQAIANARKRVKSKKRELSDWVDVWWDVRDFWTPSEENIELLFKDLRNKSKMDNCKIALTAIFAFYVDQKRPRKLRERMKREVAGLPDLEDKLHTLLHPKPKSKEQKEWEREDREYKKQIEKEEKRREGIRKQNIEMIRKNPAEVGNIGDAKQGKVWKRSADLYEAIREKSEDEERGLGYANWRDLEDEFGFEVARSFRDGCVAFWRTYDPFAFPDRRTSNTIPWLRIMGLTGLAMEAADDPNWAKKIDDSEAQLAANYSVCEMNGLPFWFNELQKQFPSIVAKTIENELRWEMHEGPQNKIHPHTLSALRYDNKSHVEEYRTTILNLLTEKEPISNIIIDNSISLLLKGPIDSTYKTKLRTIFNLRIKDATDITRKLTWLIALMYVDGNKGFQILKDWIRKHSKKKNKIDTMVRFCAGLTDHGDARFDSELRDYERIEVLAKLVPYIYKYVRVEDDANHTGMFSPGLRDKAQDTRSRLLNIVFDAPGRDSYEVFLKLSKTITHRFVKDRMSYLAKERAALDAEFEPWSGRAVADFSLSLMKTPRTEKDLYVLALVRLDDLKLDIESGDESEAAYLKRLKKETEVRTVLANRLRKSSRSLYTIGSEEELADATRTDIRFNSPQVPAPVPIEIKVADKWSFEKLCERMENQLIRQYMRVSRYGIFLLVRNGEKRWRDTQTKRLLNFIELIEALKRKLDILKKKHNNVECIEIIGIDFTVR